MKRFETNLCREKVLLSFYIFLRELKNFSLDSAFMTFNYFSTRAAFSEKQLCHLDVRELVQKLSSSKFPHPHIANLIKQTQTDANARWEKFPPLSRRKFSTLACHYPTTQSTYPLIKCFITRIRRRQMRSKKHSRSCSDLDCLCARWKGDDGKLSSARRNSNKWKHITT